MLRKNWKYTFVLVLTLVVAITLEWFSPRPIDWTPSFARQNKNPFGSHLVFQLLPDLFPNQPIRLASRTLYESQADEPEDSPAPLSNYLFLTSRFVPGQDDADALLELVSAGNDAWIAADYFGGPLADTLHIKTTHEFRFFANAWTVNFVNPALRTPEGYPMTRMNESVHFTELDTLRSAILAEDSLHRPNFLRINVGKGHFYLHTLPLAFTNYHMLYANNAEYIAKSLSYLPVRPVVWDERYKPGHDEHEGSPLRFFLQNEALRWALYVSLAALVLFVLFEAKRRQRIIPIIPPLANTTLEFTETIGRLYYQHLDHKNIAEKKIAYLLEFIRSHLYLSTEELNPPFYAALSKKTGLELEEINRLFTLIHHIQRQPSIAEVELLDLNRAMEEFYRKTG